MKTYHVDFFVNGEEYELDVPANKTALNVIRDMLDLTGAKEGCGAGECGACAMIVDGVLINGCLMLAPEMDGNEAILHLAGVTRPPLPLVTGITFKYLSRFLLSCPYKC